MIPAEFLLLDEAQDTNCVLEKVFTAQRDHAQLIMVGDSAQAIYGWRGAYDVMTDFDGVQPDDWDGPLHAGGRAGRPVGQAGRTPDAGLPTTRSWRPGAWARGMRTC